MVEPRKRLLGRKAWGRARRRNGAGAGWSGARGARGARGVGWGGRGRRRLGAAAAAEVQFFTLQVAVLEKSRVAIRQFIALFSSGRQLNCKEIAQMANAVDLTNICLTLMGFERIFVGKELCCRIA